MVKIRFCYYAPSHPAHDLTFEHIYFIAMDPILSQNDALISGYDAGQFGGDLGSEAIDNTWEGILNPAFGGWSLNMGRFSPNLAVSKPTQRNVCMQATGGCKITSLNDNHLCLGDVAVSHTHTSILPTLLLCHPPRLVNLDSKPTGQASSLCSEIWLNTEDARSGYLWAKLSAQPAA